MPQGRSTVLWHDQRMSSRAPHRPTVVANWKSNLPPGEELALAHQVVDALSGVAAAGLERVRLLLAPSSLAIVPIASLLRRDHPTLPIGLAAQDVGGEGPGAHTGEIAAAHLAGLVEAVIVGHSERRGPHGESDELIGRKVAQVAAAGLVPILCLGDRRTTAAPAERLREVAAQWRGAAISAAAAGWPVERLIGAGLTVAYEPVWAIGSGSPATLADAQAVARGLRDVAGPELPILYGGSVDAANAGSWCAPAGDGGRLDGLLVGGASLRAAQLAEIVASVAGANAR